MLQYRLSAFRKHSAIETFGKPAMFICGTENKVPAVAGADYDLHAWNFFQTVFAYPYAVSARKTGTLRLRTTRDL